VAVEYPDPGLRLDERMDPDRLTAGRPSRRLHRAHPALGLEPIEGSYLVSVPLRDLGLGWLALDEAEQRAREADFLRALLEQAARRDAPFEAEHDGETTRGRLTPATIDALVASVPEILFVEVGADWAIVTVNGVEGLGVWIDSYRAPELERELEAAWWERAQERERARAGRNVEQRRKRAVERELRARVLLLWDRRAAALVVAAAFGANYVDWRPLGWFGTPLAIMAAGFAVLLAIGWRIERWYRSA
jgi:hypothetical protein